jgi:FKBP-type peptidyl-prolyl cis-trans isomerase SlpA
MSAPVIRPGARVRLHYALSHADGTGIDASLGDAPLDFVVGDGTFAPGLEQVLMGMPAGRCERILLGPGEAFGPRDENNVHAMPRSDFGDLELSEGSLVSFALPNGDEIAGEVKCVDADADAVEVDFNHPLAGLPLQFYVEILEVIAPE